MATEEEFQIFCDNVKLLRKQKGLTQKEMAKALGICVGTLRTIEAGTFPPRAKYRVMICTSRSFHIPMWKLLRPLAAE